MAKKMAALITLAAFYNTMFVGCTTYTKMSVHEVLYANHGTISEVTTNDGERIVYDSTGAKYLKESKSILGTTQNGTRAHKFTRDLDEVTLTDPIYHETPPLVIPAGQFASHPTRKQYDCISTVVTQQGEKFHFTSPGAFIDRPNQTINGAALFGGQNSRHSFPASGTTSSPHGKGLGGATVGSSNVAIPFDSVEYVQVRGEGNSNWMKLVGVAALVYMFYAVATWDYEIISSDVLDWD